MPAIMDDPASPTIHRVSGATPYPDPNKPEMPASITPRQVTLRDRQTIATIVPFVSRDQVPASLLAYLSDQFGKEIKGGDTYPMIDPMPFEKFSAYWLQNFAGIMLLGQVDSPSDVVEGKDWSRECLGSFYIKPNYPGRSSHVCNAGFLVTDAARNRGVGRLMGETYIDWAPKLGYSYSVFNLVYETNVASCRIWDALGFKRIGRVKGCGNLKSYPDRLIDAIIYGRELGTGAGEGTGDPLLVSEERFDKIKFYLKYGRYPNGSDRAEKSRLRSAATHYKLLDNDMLMLKGKEVISDPVRQMSVARRIHEEGGHAGINKTTAVIAEKFHWSRIKETVSDVIRTCDQCKDLGKMSSSVQNQNQNQTLNAARRYNHVNGTSTPVSPDPSRMSPAPVPGVAVGPRSGSVEATGSILDLQAPIHHHSLHPPEMPPPPPLVGHPNNPYANPSDISSLLNPPLQTPPVSGFDPPHHHHHHHHHILHDQLHHDSAAATLLSLHESDAEMYHPIDPQIISHTGHHDQQAGHHHPHVTFESFHHPDSSPHSHPHAYSHPDPLSPLPGHEVEATIAYHSPHLSHPELPAHDPAVSPFHEHRHHHHPHPHQHHIHVPEQPETYFHALLHEAATAAAHERRPLAPLALPPTNNDEDDDRERAAVDRDLAMLIEQDTSASSPSSCLSSPYDDQMDVDIGANASADVNDDHSSSRENQGQGEGEGEGEGEGGKIGDPGVLKLDTDNSNNNNDEGENDSTNADAGDLGSGSGSGAGSGAPGVVGGGGGPSGKRSSIYDVVFDTPG